MQQSWLKYNKLGRLQLNLMFAAILWERKQFRRTIIHKYDEIDSKAALRLNFPERAQEKSQNYKIVTCSNYSPNTK